MNNKRYLITAAILPLMSVSVAAHAWDCSNPANWSLNVAGNECYHVGPNPNKPARPAPPTTVLLQPSSTASAGAGASSTSSGTQGQGQTNGNNTNTSTSAGGAGGQSTSNARGGNATGGAGGQAAASANTDGNAAATAAGNSTSYTDNSSYEVPRQTPPAFAGTVQPTASCKNARNGGASAPVAGISFGWSTSDEECDLRETAREFHEMGQDALAVNLLCQSKAARRLAQCTYLLPASRTVAAPVQPTGETPVTQAQLREVERRILQSQVSK